MRCDMINFCGMLHTLLSACLEFSMFFVFLWGVCTMWISVTRCYLIYVLFIYFVPLSIVCIIFLLNIAGTFTVFLGSTPWNISLVPVLHCYPHTRYFHVIGRRNYRRTEWWPGVYLCVTFHECITNYDFIMPLVTMRLQVIADSWPVEDSYT